MWELSDSSPMVQGSFIPANFQNYSFTQRKNGAPCFSNLAVGGLGFSINEDDPIAQLSFLQDDLYLEAAPACLSLTELSLTFFRRQPLQP